MVDLSEKRIVRDFLAGVAAAAAAVAGAAGEDDAEEVEEDWVEVEVVDVEMRYLKVCGMTAWNWARRANMVAVRPEGR